jgi:hypothetical protein
MKYRYTWNHVLLLAKICGRIDDEDSVTASWVQITEEHNRQTFPFTLWPLTYRTCEVTTSPAMCSPVHIPSADSMCNYGVKMFRCNEVMIICIQTRECGRVCVDPCLAELDGVTDDESEDTDDTADGPDDDTHGTKNHVNHHCRSTKEALLPCHTAHSYHRLKTRIKDAFYASQENVDSIICTGHGAAATIASCLASDMSRTYEAEREFLGLQMRRVCVDFVGFSDNVVASSVYWSECSSCINEYISITFESTETASTKTGKMVTNPRCTHVTIDTATPSSRLTLSRSVSMIHRIRKKKPEKSSGFKMERNISDYIAALNRKIMLPCGPL